MHIRTMSELLQKTVKENGIKTKELKELRDEIIIQAQEMKQEMNK